MIVFNNNGDALCGVCGDHWDNHGLGGNCVRTALNVTARAKMISAYSTKKPATGGMEGVKVTNA